MGGPGSVMYVLSFYSLLYVLRPHFLPEEHRREWDSISSHAAGLEDALLDYIAIVDKILPGWDRPLPHEFPVAQQDKFWRDDLAADACTSCGVAFSGVQCRRHHCRLCFDIFCAACCAECIDLALCPGAPIRRQRVCLPCFEVAEKDRSLLAVRRMIRENHALEQQIKDITTATEALVSARQRDEAKLRGEAMRCGCVLEQIDAEIEKQIGSPVSVTVKLPPSHKFAPRESVDANAQLALAHRQLLMGLKVAQCRAKKAVEKMDISLRVLREAICFGAASPWHVALRHASPFLTLRELHVLLTVSHTTRHSVQQGEFERQCVLAQDLPSPAWRPFVWQTKWLQDARTREYLADLAEAIRAKAESSDSESEEEEDGERGTRHATCYDVVAHLLLGAHVSPARRSVWKTVYEFLLARCDDDASGSQTGEFDAQIQGDVGRTFGVSSLRSRQSPAQMKNAMAVRKAYQRAGASTLEAPLALRKAALTNVLRAFASVSSGVGYCQGMDHVAAILLSVVDWNESDAFWMLTSLMVSPQYELDKLYGPGLPHLNVRVFQVRPWRSGYLAAVVSLQRHCVHKTNSLSGSLQSTYRSCMRTSTTSISP
jgi:ecotropic viral integration site 5 protein